MTRRILFFLLVILCVAAFSGSSYAQQPSTFIISHTDVEDGFIQGSCGTIPDGPTAANYGIDSLCSLSLFGNKIAEWTCAGAQAENCLGPVDDVIHGDTYQTDGTHFLSPLFLDNFTGLPFDPFGYSLVGFEPCPGASCTFGSLGFSADSAATFAISTTFDPYTTSSVSPLERTTFAGDLFSIVANNASGAPSTFTVSGGGADGPGTITLEPDGSVLYRAPSPIGTAAQAFVVACNDDHHHGNDCPFATINLTPLTVKIDGSNFVELLPGETLQFTATVTPKAGPVTWTLLSNPNNAGLITSGGFFTAQPVTQSEDVIVQACSTADATRCDTATVNVAFAVVSITGSANAMLVNVGPPPAQQQLSASVSGVSDPKHNAVQWSVKSTQNPPSPTVDNNGLFTVGTSASNNIAIAQVKACLVSQPANCGEFDITLVPVVTLTISPNTWASGETTGITIVGKGFGTAPTISLSDPRITFTQTSISFTLSQTTVQGNIVIPPMPAGESATLTVTSSLSTSLSQQQGSQTVTVSPVGITVGVVPTATILLDNQQQQFTATVACVTAHNFTCPVSQAVVCSINPNVGSINSSTCLYTAPASITNLQTISGKACSVFNPGACASFQITLLPITVSISPTSATLTTGQSQQFTAAVSNAPGNNQGVTWSISSPVGSISASGVYTAPTPIASAQTITVRACSVVDPTRCASAPVALVPVAVAVSPKTTALQTGQTQQFTASVTGATNLAVNWAVSASTGVAVGTISNSGLYTAPPPPITGPQTNTVSACSVVDPTKCDTATVSLISTTPVGALSPTSLTFAPQLVGTSSAAQTVTLTNIGAASLTLTSIVASGDYSVPSTTCTAPLPLNASCNISVVFTPTTTGARGGQLTVSNNASNSPQIAALSGTGIAPAACLSPASLNFGGQNVGTTSPTQAIVLTSCGSAPLAVNTIIVSGDFAQSNNCPASLAVNATCAINLTFTPTATGPRSGLLSVNDNAAGSPHTVPLSGTGTIPVANLTPSSLSFGNQNVGTTSAPQTATLSNTGSGPLTINSITTSGDYAQSNNCGTILAAGATCSINVSFTPTTTGSRSGSLSVSDAAAGSPHTASLNGTGTTPVANLTPASLSFGNLNVGAVSAPQTATLSNTGSGPLTISSITTTGDYAQGNNCGSTLAAGASCTISVTFAPTAAGSRSGLLKVTDNAAGSPHTVGLSGTGTAPAVCLSSSNLTFASQTVNTTSAAQAITLTNCGSGTMTVTSVTTSGDFSQTNNCPASLAVNGSCTINVSFRPTATGTRTGRLSVVDNAPGSPHTAGLTGTGVPPDFTLTIDASQTVPYPQTGTYQLTINYGVTFQAGLTGNVTLSLSQDFCSTGQVDTLSKSTFTSSGTGTFTISIFDPSQSGQSFFECYRLTGTQNGVSKMVETDITVSPQPPPPPDGGE
jgi:hypothetical protein